MTGGIAQVGGTNVFWEAAVPLAGNTKNQTVEGEYDFKIEYGKVGKLKCATDKKFKINVVFGPNGELVAHEACDMSLVND